MNRQDLQNIAEAYSQVHEKKDSSYLETDMKKRQENNEKARKDMEKVKGQKNPHFESKTYDPMKDPDFDHDEAEATRGQSGKNIRGNDSKKQKARLEKKRGMKLDDHPQFKKEEAEVEEGYGAPGHNPGSGEKDIARTKKYMEKKGMKGAPGLDAMAARKKEHEERRGVKKEEAEQVAEAGRMHSASDQQAGFKRIKDKESGGPGVGKVRSDDEIKKEKGGQAFLDRIAKAKAKMNKEDFSGIAAAYQAVYNKEEEVEEVDEAMSSYDRNRKRAAQRAADRNAARAAGKTGVVPGVGYVSPRKEKETYVDSAGTTRHKSGAKNEEFGMVDENRAAMGRINKEYKRKKEAEEMEARTKSAKDKKKDTSHMGKGNPMYDPSVNTRAKNFKFTGEEVEDYTDFLIGEGYDCSELTWDEVSEEYASLDEGLRSAVKRLLGKKDAPAAEKPESRGEQLRKKYNVGPEKSDTSAKMQILQKTRAKKEADQKQYGDSKYSKSVAKKSADAHDRYLKGGYSKYGADDARGKGNKAAKRAAALRKEELEGNPVYEATKKDIKEFVGGAIKGAMNSAGQALATPVGAGLAAGTVGAVTGGKKKVKKSLATGAGAAAGAALGGLPGAVIGGIAGNALS